jgi:AraC-like DNA-binding protein
MLDKSNARGPPRNAPHCNAIMHATSPGGSSELRANYSDLGNAHDWMASICGPHSLRVSRPENLSFRQSGMVLRSMSTTIGYVEYGTDVTVAVHKEDPLACYSISLPLIGQQELSAGGRLWLSDQNHGLIVSPDDTQDLTIAGNCRKIHVAIPSRSINVVLESLLHHRVDAPLSFTPEMSAATGEAASWWRMVKFLVAETEQSQSQIVHFVASSEFEGALLKALLLSQPNNYSDQLSRQMSSSIPHYLTRARDYIHANAREPIALEDLERHAGVSRYKLFQAFSRYLGCSPMAYLKRYRLESIRRVLLEDRSTQNVSSVAMSWGLTHLGRFSAEYREAFGESPSATIRQRM